MTIFTYMYVLWVQKVGKTTKRNGKKESESKVLAILLKQIALQKSFINMTKAKQNVDTIKYISMTSFLTHTVAQPTKWRFLPKNLS